MLMPFESLSRGEFMENYEVGSLAGREEISLTIRLVRWALVVWLSPVILLVLSIGLIGMLVSNGKSQANRVAEVVQPI